MHPFNGSIRCCRLTHFELAKAKAFEICQIDESAGVTWKMESFHMSHLCHWSEEKSQKSTAKNF